MKNKYLFSLLIIVGLLSALAPFEVYADIASKTIGTSSTNRAVSVTFQRKIFYANGRFWVFYSDGVNMVFRTSTDGNTWSTATVIRACDNGEKFSIWFDGNYFHYAYCAETAGAPIYYRRGTPNGGSITWSPEQVAVGGASGTTYYVPCIAVDTNGYPWIGYRFVKGTSPKRPYITKSSRNDGVWQTQSGFPYDLSGWDAAAWVVAPIPLTSGKMFVIYTSFGHYIRGKRWTGTWGSEAKTVNGISSDFFSAVAEGDDVHLAFLSSTTILYSKYSFSSNSWGTEKKIKSPATSTSAPVLSYDPVSGYVFCFWMASNHIYYRKSIGGIWISPPTDWVAESETLSGNNYLTSFYSASNDHIGLAYVTKTSKPYNVRFCALSTPKVEKAFILVVENPGGAPSGTKYYARISNNGYEREIALTDPEGYGTYTGSVGGMPAGEYDWEVYYSFGSVKETIASGHETIDRVKVNIVQWSWTGVITGQKWVDCNGNGKWDEGEYTIGGWPIRLYKKIEGEWVLYWEEFTGRWQLYKWGNGIYKFFNLGPGKYRVEQVEQDGWVRTYPDDGYDINLGPGELRSGLNFGDHWTGPPDSFLKIDAETGGILYGTQGGLWWATYGSYAYIIPNPDSAQIEYPIGPDYPAGGHYLNDEVGGPGIGHVRYRVYTLHGEMLGSFGYEAYEWPYDVDYYSSREVLDGKAFPGAQYFPSMNEWRATKWHSGDPANDPLAVEVELGETGFYRVAYYVLEEGVRAMSYELYRDGNLIGSRLSYPTGYFKGGKYIVFLVTLRHAPQNLTMLAWTDKANAIIAGVFIDKLCEVPLAFDKTFELTVAYPEDAPQGVRYLATLYQPTQTFTVELKDPDQDGKYTGTIPELDPGDYHYRFYYILDSVETTIKEGDETLDQSMTNTATWSWKVKKSFELTVENPDKAPGYPDGKYYGAVSSDGTTWPAEWTVELVDPVAAETFTGTIENLAPGHYYWKIYYVGSPEIIIAQGEEDIFHDTTNVYSIWVWSTFSKTFELTVTNPSEAPSGVHYWGAVSSDGTTWPNEWKVELSGSNGVYMGSIMNLGPGQYHYRFYYTIDPYSTQYNITSGTEEIVDRSITNKATWNWITKTFELTVINPEGAPDGVTYFATLYQPTRTFTVELKLDQDGKYMGSIPYLDPGVYHYRFYYILDSVDTTIKEGDETLTESKTNTAVWKWKVEKTFELEVENPGGAPSSTYYYASIWNSTWSEQIELTGDGGTYTGSVGDLDPGYYDWTIFCTYHINSVTETDVIAQGQNEYLGQSKTNSAEWSWNFEISGKKWSDDDGDGEWDAGEEALGGWTIKLYKKVDGQWILFRSTNTIEDGEETGVYYFVNLPPGFYIVEEEPKAGWHQTFPDGNHYVPISLSDNGVINDKNFGNHFSTVEKRFKLKVKNPSEQPEGVEYFGAVSPDGNSWTEVKLEDPEQDGTYEGKIPDLAPSTYYWKIYYVYDSSTFTIEDGMEELLASKTNEATWKWPGTTLSAEKTAQGNWVRTYSWTIEKSVQPEALNLFVNKEGTIHYTITVTKGAYTDRYSVSGTITVTNGGEAPTQGLEIVDVVQYKTGSGKFQDLTSKVIVSTGSDTIGPGETKQYSYEVEFTPVEGAIYRNEVRVTITNHAGHMGEPFGPSPRADFSLPVAPTLVNDQVQVCDDETISQGLVLVSTNEPVWPQSVSSTTVFEFDKTVKSNAEGTYSLEDVAMVIGDTIQTSSGIRLATVIVSQPFQPREYCTYTQGGWGSKPSGNNPGKLLHDNFDDIYSSSICLGLPGHSMTFETADAITDYLPAGGTPDTLDDDYVNPEDTSSGVFGGQVLALKLNVDFSDAEITPIGFGDLILCNTGTSLDGQTVREILGAANEALGGGSLPDGYTISQLNDLVTKLNEAFDGGTPSAWALGHLQH